MITQQIENKRRGITGRFRFWCLKKLLINLMGKKDREILNNRFVYILMNGMPKESDEVIEIKLMLEKEKLK